MAVLISGLKGIKGTALDTIILIHKVSSSPENIKTWKCISVTPPHQHVYTLLKPFVRGAQGEAARWPTAEDRTVSEEVGSSLIVHFPGWSRKSSGHLWPLQTALHHLGLK